MIKKKLKNFEQRSYYAFIFSACLMTVFYVFMKPILVIFGAIGNTIDYSQTYIFVCLIGTIFVELSIGLNTFIAAQGASIIAMFSVLIGAALNLILF